MDGIDRDGPVPVWQQLAGILRHQIRSGDLATDRPLPSHATLRREHGVALGTAAKAVRMLIGQGYARVVPGKGTFVNPPGEWQNNE